MQGLFQGASGTYQGGFSFPAGDDFICTSLPDPAFNLGSLLQMSTISEYDLGGEGDLFKAPEPILWEPVLALDPIITAAMSMMPGAGSIIRPETIEVLADIPPIGSEDPLSEMFFECKKDLIAKSAIIESPLEEEEASELNFDAVQAQTVSGADESRSVVEGPLQKSVSIGCLSSVYLNIDSPNLLDFHDLDLEKALCIRRAYSEGDIQLLLDLGDTKIADKMEERRQKIYRYRKKRTKRNFGRKIKYACRKALADSQPRVRGRFARTEDKNVEIVEVMK